MAPFMKPVTTVLLALSAAAFALLQPQSTGSAVVQNEHPRDKDDLLGKSDQF